MVEALDGLKLMEFSPTEGICDCCDNSALSIQPMIRPEVEPLSDEALLKVIEDEGEEFAQSYHERSRNFVRTKECASCRSLTDEQYFLIQTVKEDR